MSSIFLLKSQELWSKSADFLDISIKNSEIMVKIRWLSRAYAGELRML